MSDVNGWSNWETYNFNNWHDNYTEEDLDMLKDQYEEQINAMPNGFMKDLTAGSFAEIDWGELKRHAQGEDDE